MPNLICRIGDYYIYRGDPNSSESSFLQTTIKVGAIAALFLVGYTIGRNSSVICSKDDPASQPMPFVNLSQNPLTSATLTRSENSSQQSLDGLEDMGDIDAVVIPSSRASEVASVVSSKDDSVSQSMPFVNILENPLTSVTLARSPNSSEQSLGGFENIPDLDEVLTSSSKMNEVARQSKPFTRSTSEQDNSGHASSTNFLNGAASTAAYTSKHSSTRSSRSSTPHNTTANPLPANADQPAGAMINVGMNRLSLADQTTTNRIVNQSRQASTPESFGTISSSCSSASTAQNIVDCEYVMIQVRNDSQTSSTISSARSEES